MMTEAKQQIIRYCIFGYAALALVLIGGLTWSAFARIDGAIIASGTVVVKGETKKVQHLEGGVISDVLVQDGQYVTAGQTVLQLDTSEIKSRHSIVTARYRELLAKKARLEAEQSEREQILFPEFLLKNSAQDNTRLLISGQKQLFSARKKHLQGKIQQYSTQISQLQQVVKGLIAQKNSKELQYSLLSQETKALHDLWKKDLVKLPRLLALQRQHAGLKGEIGKLSADIARTNVSISETRIKRLQVKQHRQTNILSELREVSAKLEEYDEQRQAVLKKLENAAVRAPKSGYIHQLQVHTIGAVISPGETLMIVVPKKEQLELEAAIDPKDIARVKLGGAATLKFSVFEQLSSPDLRGEVTNISADLNRRKQDSSPFYTVRINLPAQELKRLGSNKLKPGMPAEIFIQTGERTVLSYLVKPIVNQFSRAFRER